jgi:chromosome segregation ATPase
MFSHRTSRRFTEDDRDPKPGPGAYTLPSALDDKAPSMEGSQRWQDGSTELPGPGDYSVSPDCKDNEVLAPVLPQRRALPEKENRAPSAGSLRKCKGTAAGGLRSPREGLSDAEKPRREDARLTAQLETMRDELKLKTRENKDLQNGLTAKDHKVEELQRRTEHLASEKREAQRKMLEVEAERDAKRRQLHEKDQELQSLQRKSEHNRATAEERKRALERKDDEHKTHIAEVQRLKTEVDLLQESWSTSLFSPF